MNYCVIIVALSVWEISGRQVAMASEMTHQATSFFRRRRQMGDLSVDLIARDRERAREKGRGARAGRGIARMPTALREYSVAMSLERFGFSSSASSVTASTSLPAGEVVSRANVFCARPQCVHAKYVRPGKLH